MLHSVLMPRKKKNAIQLRAAGELSSTLLFVDFKHPGIYFKGSAQNWTTFSLNNENKAKNGERQTQQTNLTRNAKY